MLVPQSEKSSAEVAAALLEGRTKRLLWLRPNAALRAPR